MNRIEESAMTNRILEAMKSANFSPATIDAYRAVLVTVQSFFRKNGETEFDAVLLEKYMAQVKRRYDGGELSWSHMRLVRKAVQLLKEIAVNREVSFERYCHPPEKVSDYYEGILGNFRDFLDKTTNITEKIKKRKVRECRKFFVYLENLHINNIADVSLKIADEYATKEAVRLGSSAMANLYNSLCALCKCLSKSDIAFFDFSPALNMNPTKRTKIMPAFNQSEVEAIFSAITPDVSNAKRDLAMLAIAAELGIRACDIASLKRTDIHWEAHKIRFVQSKTKIEVILPLSAKVGNAIADYLLNERPDSDSEYIFIRSLAPYIKINSETVLARLLKYMDISGVSHRQGSGLGTHSFRRYVASQMLDNGVDADTVSQILGQRRPESLKPYIRVSKKRLYNCALGFSRVIPEGGLFNELYV